MLRDAQSSRHIKCIPVPVMLQMLELLENETNGDAILAGVSRTLSQAIDELTAIQSVAFDVARDAEVIAGFRDDGASNPRRLC